MTVEEFQTIPLEMQALVSQIAEMKRQHALEIKAKEDEITRLRLKQMGLTMGQKRLCSEALSDILGDFGKTKFDTFVILGINDSSRGVYIGSGVEGDGAFATVTDLSVLLECEVL